MLGIISLQTQETMISIKIMITAMNKNPTIAVSMLDLSLLALSACTGPLTTTLHKNAHKESALISPDRSHALPPSFRNAESFRNQNRTFTTFYKIKRTRWKEIDAPAETCTLRAEQNAKRNRGWNERSGDCGKVTS